MSTDDDARYDDNDNPSVLGVDTENINETAPLKVNKKTGAGRVELSDHTGRQNFNTVFGEQVSGIRHADIAAQFQYGFPLGNASIDVANGGTITNVDSMLVISSGTNVAGSSGISNRKALRYMPGHEAYTFFTVVFTEAKPDSYQRAGLFDSENGFFIGYEETD